MVPARAGPCMMYGGSGGSIQFHCCYTTRFTTAMGIIVVCHRGAEAHIEVAQMGISSVVCDPIM